MNKVTKKKPQKTAEVNKKFSKLSEDHSLALKKYLTAGWFQDFTKRYKKEHGIDVPKYSTVINILNGRSNNFKVLSILQKIAMENKAIEDSISQLVNGSAN